MDTLDTKKRAHSTKKQNTRATSKRRPRANKTQGKAMTWSLRREIRGILLLTLAGLVGLSLFSSSMGSVGTFFQMVFTYIFGIGAIVAVAGIAYWGWLLLYCGRGIHLTTRGILFTFLVLSVTSFYTLYYIPEGRELEPQFLPDYGGILGALIAKGFHALFGSMGSLFVMGVVILCFFIVLTGFSLGQGLRRAGVSASKGALVVKEKASEQIADVKEQLVEWRQEHQERREAYDYEKDTRFSAPKEREAVEEACVPVHVEEAAEGTFQEEESEMPYELEDVPVEEPQGAEDMDVLMHDPILACEGADVETGAVSVSTEEVIKPRRIERPYTYPSLDILAKGKPNVEASEMVTENARLLESTLESFGIAARVVHATQGPAVTRYELEPARGVKVSKIVNLTDDIALNLAATGIRMEAPIPGKAAIGIEIPNKSISSVNLRDVLESEEFFKAKGGIPVGLGKDIAGKAVITDLSKMPHLLVAGSTGSGKSVCINTLIASILFSRKPDEVKMILIDPKMVELSNYRDIPHLMTPVVTDMKKAASVLRWAVREMESRYSSFAEVNVRDIKRFNELHPEHHMPLLVIIIDELADLMMVSPADVEEHIARLAQKARAAGIHLVLATQRPSVDVITGIIKANVPSRISFAVSSQIDSRTILDMAGAEKLLGKGDMLFNPIGASKPVRIQGAFISDDEVERLVSFVKKQGNPEYDDGLDAMQEQSEMMADDDFMEDELLQDAIDFVLDAGQASTSMLQRKLRIGFTRAGRLMDTMEQLKIIGPHVGSKPRDLLMSRAQVEALWEKK